MDVYPTLTYRNVKAALAWLENAFGLERRIFDGDGADDITHAAVLHCEGMVLVESERPEDLHGSHAGDGWVYTAVGDLDAHFQRAKAAGVELVNEPTTPEGAHSAATAPVTSSAICGASGP